MKTLVRILFIVATVTSIISCSNSNDTASDTTAAVEGNPYGGFPVDPPAPNETVLTVTVRGKVHTYSLEQLAELGATTVKLYEPFIQKDSTFTGVALSVLFAETAIVGEDSVETVALNEYAYTNTAAAFSGSDGFESRI